MMRRILYPVVMCLVAFTAFGHTTRQITHNENQSTEYQSILPEAIGAVDSLSIILGDVYGIVYGEKLHGIIDADIDTEQVTKTINQIFNSQEGKDYIIGKQFGLTFAQINQKLRDDYGCDLNKQLLLEHLKAELLTENPIDSYTSYAMEVKMIDFLEQIYSNGEAPSDALTDSLSSIMGTVDGFKIRYAFSKQDADFEQLFKGIEYSFEQEYDKTAAIEQAGIEIVQIFDDIQRRAHMPLNKDLFMEHLISGLSVESTGFMEHLISGLSVESTGEEDLSGLSVESSGEEDFQTLSDKIDPLIKRVAGLSPDGIANKKAGEAYMEQLRKDQSFKFTNSGLAYKMLKEGNGKNSTEDDEVNVVNYVGKHLDGTVFDSSEGEPMPRIKYEIKGVSEMLQLMKPGDKAIVVIPSNLAYGAIPNNYAIGPNETLIFEIEIIDSQQ